MILEHPSEIHRIEAICFKTMSPSPFPLNPVKSSTSLLTMPTSQCDSLNSSINFYEIGYVRTATATATTKIQSPSNWLLQIKPNSFVILSKYNALCVVSTFGFYSRGFEFVVLWRYIDCLHSTAIGHNTMPSFAVGISNKRQ